MKKHQHFLFVVVLLVLFGSNSFGQQRLFNSSQHNSINTNTDCYYHPNLIKNEMQNRAVIWSSNMNSAAAWTYANEPGTLATHWTWLSDTSQASTYFKQYVHSSAYMQSPTANQGVWYFDGITNLVTANYGYENATLTNATPINTIGHSGVTLKFYQLYKNLNNDSTFVEISNDNVTWHQIMANPAITNNGHGNTYAYGFVEKNISLWAANKTTVWIRFRFVGQTTSTANPNLGGYGWMIDDVSIEDAPNNRIEFNDIWGGFVNTTTPFKWSGYTQIPSGQNFPVSMAASIINTGGMAQTNVKLNIKKLNTGVIKSSTSLLPSQAPIEIDTLEVTDLDTLNAIGTYKYSMFASSDSIPSSLYKDTVSIVVNNKINGLYSRDDNYYNGSRRWNGVTGSSVNAFQMANLVEVTTNDSIYAKSISFVVGAGTRINAPVKAILYRGWSQTKTICAESDYYFIQASDIAAIGNNPTSIELFFTDYTGTLLNKDSSYFVAIQAYGGTDSVWLAVGSNKIPQPDYALYIFDTDNKWYYYPRGSAPAMIRLNTSPVFPNIGLPAAAGAITGPVNVCHGQNNVTYKVAPIADATSYFWNFNNTTTQTTADSVTLNFTTLSPSGILTVFGHNAVGNGPSSTLNINVNSIPANPGNITGLTNVMPGQQNVAYNVTASANTTYIWTLPVGANGSSTSNTINVNFTSASITGYLTVQAHNLCGSSTSSSVLVSVNAVIPNCSAQFDMVPDSTTPHKYFIVNNSSGIQPLKYYWSWGDGTHDTTAYPNHTFNSTGYYGICLKITDSVGCTNTYCDSTYLQKDPNTTISIQVIPKGSLSINVNNLAAQLKIYPNPTIDKLIVDINNVSLFKDATISIYDLQGKLLLNKAISQSKTELNVNGFAKGMYVVKVLNNNNTIVRKFVKE